MANNERPKPVQSIPVYKEGTSFTDFLCLFQICCQLNDWIGDNRKLRLAPYLSGLPLQMYLALTKEATWANMTYAQVKDRLTELVTPQEHEILAEQKIQERMQLQSENQLCTSCTNGN